jgi:hypothetical protein
MSDKLSETDFAQLTSYNNSYKTKMEEYTNTLSAYKSYIENVPTTKTVSDYDYWPGYTFNIPEPTHASNNGISQIDCLTNCANNNNCLGASFYSILPTSTPSPGLGHCYEHSTLTSTQDQLIASTNNVAIVNKSRYYLLLLNKLNNELKQINSERIAFYTSLNSKFSNTKVGADASITAFSEANAAFIQNKRDINKALTNLGTSDEQYNYNSSIVAQENLKFQILLIILYGIIFVIFKLFDVNSEIATMITIVTGIITIMIIIKTLYQYA